MGKKGRIFQAFDPILGVVLSSPTPIFCTDENYVVKNSIQIRKNTSIQRWRVLVAVALVQPLCPQELQWPVVMVGLTINNNNGVQHSFTILETNNSSSNNNSNKTNNKINCTTKFCNNNNLCN